MITYKSTLSYDRLNLFKSISVNDQDYAYDVKISPYPERFEHLRIPLLHHFQANRSAHRYRYVAKFRPRPTVDRLAFPIDGGYVTVNDPRYIKCMIGIYNDLLDINISEPKILVNHAFLFPLVNQIYYNDLFKVPADEFRDVESFSKSFEKLWRFLRDNTSLTDIKIKAKKITSPGFPMTTIDGEQLSARDVMYGFDTDDVKFVELNRLRLRKDWSKVKKDWLLYFDELVGLQNDLLSVGLSSSNIIDASECLALANDVNGYRFNSIDKAIIEGKYDGKKQLYGKNRPFLEYTRDGIVTGMLDVQKLAVDVGKQYRSNFAPLRLRPINASCFITNIPHQIDAQLFLHNIEKSKNGFLSENPACLSAYDDFLADHEHYDFVFLSGDRTNAETFVTTNFEYLVNLIPQSHREYMKLANTHIHWDHLGPVISQGLQSGAGWTTGLNVIVGLYEAIYTISKILGFDFATVADAYFLSVINDKSYTRLSEDISFKLFLPTDDIPLVLAFKGNKPKFDLTWAKQRMMEWETSDTGFVTFGMQVGRFPLKHAESSQYSKALYVETPGNWTRDCFAISERSRLFSDTSLIEKHLFDNFGIDFQFYHKHGKLFLDEMARYGIDPTSIFSEYSPKDRLVLNRFVSIDPLSETEVIEPSVFGSFFNYIRRQ